MKTTLSVLFLAGALGSGISSAAGAESVISKDRLSDTNYCHIKFPAIEERTLSWKSPILKDPGEGDIIIFTARVITTLWEKMRFSLRSAMSRGDSRGSMEVNWPTRQPDCAEFILRGRRGETIIPTQSGWEGEVGEDSQPHTGQGKRAEISPPVSRFPGIFIRSKESYERKQ